MERVNRSEGSSDHYPIIDRTISRHETPPTSMDGLWIATIIFIVTYALISIRRFPKVKVDRPAAALLGAGLMIVFGVVGPSEAIASINLDIILLLVGMMILVAGLELCGFFEWVSLRMIKYSKDQFTFLVLTMVVTGTLSALVLNDTVVLLFTPIIIRTCRLLKSNPVPFLIAEAIAANIGSVATAVGNPQNAYIATKAGISFLDFSVKLAPVAAVCMLVAIAMMYIICRKDIRKGNAHEFRQKILKDGWNAFEEEIVNGDAFARSGMKKLKEHRTGLFALLGITGVTFIAFMSSHVIGVPLAVIAFLAGVAALFILPLVSDLRSKDMLAGVDWSIILFFVGLFVVLQGVKDSGLLFEIRRFFPGFEEGALPKAEWLTALSALLSNLVSNVPSVMLLSELIPLSETDLWFALASSSTLAGNATILGAAANVIVAEKAEGMGVELSFWKFTLVGFPIAMATLFVSTIMLMILF
ncbi:MAG: anion transporter [Thermoplasmata archaeon]|nr:anion transporter [Thermoplasmata archaeon]TFG68033.1 MAG: anion transporter [Methanomassiliicoccus sp.]